MILTTALKLSISLILPLSVGYLFVTTVARNISLNIMLKLSLGFGLGLGILSQWMLILSMVEIPFGVGNIATFLVIIALTTIYSLFKRSKTSTSLKQPPSSRTRIFPQQHNPLYTIAILYIGFIFIFVYWHSLNIPISEWDAIATSAFEAKIFFFDRTIHQLRLPHPSYPLHIPFVQAWIALNLNEWDDILLKIIFPLTFTAYSAVHYAYLKSVTNKAWALGGLCLLYSSNFFVHHATIAYRDFSMMYYNCTTIILLTLWERKRNPALLLLASLFAGFTTFVKLEGTGYLVIYTVLLVLILAQEKTLPIHARLKDFFIFILPSYGICLLYHSYKFFVKIAALAGRTNPVLTPEQLFRIPVILREFTVNLFLSGNWNLIWFMLLLSLIKNYRDIGKHSHIKLMLLTLSMFFGIYLIIPMTTSTLIDHPTLLSRVLLHFFPLAPILIILTNFRNDN